MAKIYPEHFPQESDTKRSAERRVYEALLALPEGYTAFYSVSWQVRNPHSGAEDGEADFIVAHPEWGVMILEVKGGRIRYDSGQSQWYSLDRHEDEHPIKDPIQQARNSKGALLSKLRETPGWDGRYLTIAYMVVFPDVSARNVALRSDFPRALLIDANDMGNLAERLEQGFAWFAGEEGRQGALGRERLRFLESFLAHSFTLHSRLGVELEQEEARILQLTEQQMGVLRFIQSHRRALIEGCAGSGKTTLALEKARQLSEQGFDTLLLCFNAPLAEHLRQRAPEDVGVFHFHDLCKHLAKSAGLGYRASRNEQDWFDRVLPEMLFEALMELGPQYDAVIVDEGQDFRDEWWEIIQELLRDKENGIWYVFFDNNQNIYHRHASLEGLMSSPPFTLNENCRNTRAIHEVVRQFHVTPHLLTSRAPQGRVPEIFYFSSEQEQETRLKQILHRLVNEEGVQPAYITLLTTRSPEKTICRPGRKMGNFVLMEWGDLNLRKNDIRVSSAHRFKGLENRMVILTGLEDSDPDWLNPLLYVACSRARTHLVIIAHEHSRAHLQSFLKGIS
ncbi:MAG: ATP-binding domain-containing protein [Anaerolineales bacterium]